MSEFVLFRVVLGTLGVAVFGIIFGLLYKGIDRKIAAHMQGRIGPPIRQPFRDIVKLFTKEISKVAFKEPFISKWLFDVEIFNRLMIHFGVDKTVNHMLEIPLKRWVDQGDSKVKFTYFFKLWIDLYKINKVCKSSRK